MKRLFLTLLLLFGANTVVVAGDFEDGRAAYRSKDYATALAKLKKAAQAGDTRAQISLGFMYEDGKGVTQDYVQAVRWYTKAAELGDASAQFLLGSMYENGKGVAQDYVQAVRWYTKAAEAGDVDAQYKLGQMYANGQGVPQDYLQAARWYTKAAEAGNVGAQQILALMYDRGEGVQQNDVQAVRWYTKAAEAGDALAQFVLGRRYAYGNGVPQDYVQAYMWSNLAATRGSKPASDDRDILAQRMTPAQIAEAQKLAREWKPTTGTAPDRRQDTGGREPAATGTGFVISRQGHVLTNNHVVDGCMTIRTTSEGGKKQLIVVGTDPGNDLALLKLPSPSPNMARFRDDAISDQEMAWSWSDFPCTACWRLKPM